MVQEVVLDCTKQNSVQERNRLFQRLPEAPVTTQSHYTIPNCSPKVANELLSSSEPKISPRKEYFLMPGPPVFLSHPGLREGPRGRGFGEDVGGSTTP